MLDLGLDRDEIVKKSGYSVDIIDKVLSNLSIASKSEDSNDFTYYINFAENFITKFGLTAYENYEYIPQACACIGKIDSQHPCCGCGMYAAIFRHKKEILKELGHGD
ncbi:MAG: hypothetical protein WC284_14470 [Candidimonas sp.]